MTAGAQDSTVTTREPLEPERRRRDAIVRRQFELVLIGFVTAAGVLRSILVWRLNVNWDEFYYLSFVHDALNGRLSLALQTFHVHFFKWVATAASNEVDQIIAARLIYFALSLGSCALVVAMARRFVPRTAALFSGLCYLSYSNVLEHGLSFRTDGIASFLTLAALALAVWRPAARAWCAVAGSLVAIGFLVTIKMVIVLPTIAILMAIGARDRGRYAVAKSLGVFLVTLVAVAIVGFVLHAATVKGATAASAAAYSRRAGAVTFGRAGILPQWGYLVNTITQNGFVWLSVVAGLVLALSNRAIVSRGTAIKLLTLGLPLASVIFYRNSYPYFYVLLVPPVLVLCGVPFEAVLRRADADRSYQRVGVYMIAGIVWAFSIRFGLRVHDGVDHQRRLVDGVHEIFPDPVPYIDRSGIVSSFPKVGLFMSTWGLESYLERGVPVFDGLLRSRRPPLLIADAPTLALTAIDTAYAGVQGLNLLPPDLATLRENFIPHWGPVYVAGKRLTLGAADTTISLIIPGPYTVESGESIEIDGVVVPDNGVIELQAGPHRLAGGRTPGVVTLRWGMRLRRPSASLPARHIFERF